MTLSSRCQVGWPGSCQIRAGGGILVSDFYALPPGPGYFRSGHRTASGLDQGVSGRGLNQESPSIPVVLSPLSCSRRPWERGLPSSPLAVSISKLEINLPSPDVPQQGWRPRVPQLGLLPSVSTNNQRVSLLSRCWPGFLHPRFSSADFYDTFPEYCFHCPGWQCLKSRQSWTHFTNILEVGCEGRAWSRINSTSSLLFWIGWKWSLFSLLLWAHEVENKIKI